jgi:hypothetical protein
MGPGERLSTVDYRADYRASARGVRLAIVAPGNLETLETEVSGLTGLGGFNAMRTEMDRGFTEMRGRRDGTENLSGTCAPRG